MNRYQQEMDNAHFRTDFEAATIARIAAEARPARRTMSRVRMIAACTAAVILLTVGVFAVRQLLSGAEIAARIGDQKLSEVLASENFTPQSQTSGDYTFTLHGAVSGEDISTLYLKFDAPGTTRSFLLISVARTDGTPITTEDAIYGRVAASPIIQNTDTGELRAFSLNGASGIYFIADGVYYHVMSMTSLDLAQESGKVVYIAAYEGLMAPVGMDQNGKFVLREDMGIGAIWEIS